MHDVLEHVLWPLVSRMEDGINMICPDGKHRLCVPVLAQYISDYKEQRSVACVLQGFCPKCGIPMFRKPTADTPDVANTLEGFEQDEDEFLVDTVNLTTQHPPRDNFEAKHLRAFYQNDPKALWRYGYHATIPFIERHIYSSVYNSLASDLLHQVSKCFYDYIHQWVLIIISEKPMGASHPARGKANATGAARKADSKQKVRGEIDVRFSHIPLYPGLRAFHDGITLTSRWQGNEFKNMLKVYLGVVIGLLPTDVIRLIKAYLDIHV